MNTLNSGLQRHREWHHQTDTRYINNCRRGLPSIAPNGPPLRGHGQIDGQHQKARDAGLMFSIAVGF